MNDSGPVLLSWVAYNNDPFLRKRDRTYEFVDGERVPGPTLTLLFDPDSRYCHKVKRVVLLYNRNDEYDVGGYNVFRETEMEIRKADSGVTVESMEWIGSDPTNYKSIFEFLRAKLPLIRSKFRGRELIVHVSPGTPAMQTVWVLMAETGLIDQPFRMVKSIKKTDRKTNDAVLDVSVGLETFYKLFKGALPKYAPSADQAILADPTKFKSSRMQTVFSEARRFAQLRAPILILGPRGTGKTTLAGWIRSCSPFRKPGLDKEWLALPCGQYNPSTMRAELFGYRKGAFTGANENKEGILAQANGDTLFLDEIGDMSRDLQRLLIKALEEKKYHPIGDTRPRDSDFRLISATNMTLEALREKLDHDFFDRISTFQIELPALNEIPEDIPALWESVLSEAARRAGVQPDPDADMNSKIAKELQRIGLPGNIRDLFRIAYHLLAALNDPDFTASSERIVQYAIGSVESRCESPVGESAVAKRIAAAFVNNQNLFNSAGIDRVETKAFERSVKKYLARELFQEARRRQIPVDDLCDVTERALLNWRKNN